MHILLIISSIPGAAKSIRDKLFIFQLQPLLFLDFLQVFFFMLLKRSYLTISLLIQPLKLLIYLYIAFYLYTTILLILIESSQKHVGQAAAFNLPTFFFIYTIYLYNQVRPHKVDILIEYVFNLFIYISLINRRFLYYII